MHAMNIMGKDGHKSLAWGTDGASVATAKQVFDDLTGSGYTAFRQGDGDKDGRMKKFDPAASEIVMVTPLRGG